MEKVKIDIYISDLLYSYDCVIVPDFGGFIANYASAQLHTIQHKFQAPSKKISFNQQLKSNDGLLTNHIAGKKEISYSEAQELVRSFVDQSNKGLQEGDRIKIEKVGTLFLDPEKNIQFIPENSTNYLLDSFGLETFRAMPIQREGAEKRIVAKINEQKNIALSDNSEKVSTKFYWLRAAAVFFFLVLSTFLLNIKYNWLDTGVSNFAALNFSFAEAPSYEAKKLNLSYNTNALETEVKKRATESGIVPFRTSLGEATLLHEDNRSKKTNLEKDNTFVSKSFFAHGFSYHVVGGCFSTEKNAKDLLGQLQSDGFEARLLGRYKIYHAVSIGSFNTREEAVNFLAKVRNQDHPDAWLLEKAF